MADIENGFLMVSVDKEDCHVLQFLWVDDPIDENPEPVELRFTRVVFQVSSSPFLLNATIQYHLENTLDAKVSLIRKHSRSFYVDDLIADASREEEAYHLYRSAKDVMKVSGFNLMKFVSNFTSLQDKIEGDEESDEHTRLCRNVTEADETYAESNLCPGQRVRLGEKNVLGVCWDIASDRLVMSLGKSCPCRHIP